MVDDSREERRESRVLVVAKVPSERDAQRVHVDGVRGAELLAARARRHDDRGAPVVGIRSAFDEAVGFHSLYEAAERLAASTAARAMFGDAFVEHYAATRQWEEREFRKAVTDWELARYFEII